MPFLFRSCGAALTASALLAGFASAQVSVRAPLTQVDVGPGQVRVQVPFVGVIVSGMPQPPPPPIFIAPPPGGGAQPVPAGAPVPSAAEFAASFKPLPGTYEVVLLHPFTQQPVKVAFTLPRSAGYYRVRVRPRFIEFDAPDHVVEIRFFRNGQVGIEKY